LTTDVLGRRFLPDGTPIGFVEFQVNTVREYTQHAPHVASLPGDGFVVAWVGYDGWDYGGGGYFAGGYGVRAQRLRVAPSCPPAPRLGCKYPLQLFRGKLLVRDRTPDAADSLSWAWLRGVNTTVAQMGDPLGTHAY